MSYFRGGCASLVGQLVLLVSCVWLWTSTGLCADRVRVAVVESRRLKAYDQALRGFEEAITKRGFEPEFTRYVVGSGVNSPEELDAYCREKLAAYKVPKLYEFRDELPKSAIGKVLRRELREQELGKAKKES